MRKFVNRMVVAVAVCALTGVLALAEGKSGKVTFYKDVTVNGTLVKKGTYKVKFDEKTNEVAIMNGKETVVTTTGQLEKRDAKAARTQSSYVEKNNANVLTSITFAGENQAIVISDGNGPIKGGQK